MKQLSTLSSLQAVLKFFVTGSVLSTITVAGSAVAGYTPSSDSKQPDGGGTTTGVRSCGTGNAEESLLALAPRQHVGETALTHPTFVWYVPEADEFPIVLELYEIDPSGSETRFISLVEQRLDSTPGIMTFTLPQSEVGLTPGNRYLWEVTLECDEDDRSARTIAGAELVVTSQVAGKSLNPSISNPVEEINRYAETGLWYDAFGLASLNPEDSSFRAIQASLLEDLADLEEPTEGPSPNSSCLPFSEQLRLIAE